MRKTEFLKNSKFLVQFEDVQGIDLDKIAVAKDFEFDEWMHIESASEPFVFSSAPLITLEKRLETSITSFDFYMIMGQIAKAARILDNLGCGDHDLCWCMDCVYYSSTTRELKFIYLPYTNDATFAQLVQDVIYSCTQTNIEERYVSRFAYYFKKHDLTPSAMMDYIASQDEEVACLLDFSKQEANEEKEMVSKVVSEVVSVEEPKVNPVEFAPVFENIEQPEVNAPATTFLSTEEDDNELDGTALFEDVDPDFSTHQDSDFLWHDTDFPNVNNDTAIFEENDPFFDGPKITPPPFSFDTNPIKSDPVFFENDGPADGTVLMDQTLGEIIGDKTVLMDADMDVPPLRPAEKSLILTRISNREKIVVNRNDFVIGKSQRVNGYTITGNGAISREHVRIIKRGNKFFVSDLNSSNGTFVNGKGILPRTEICLFSGDILKLGDEDFNVEIQ